MKNKKVFIILSLIIICIILLIAIFSVAIIQTKDTYFETDKIYKESIMGNKIIDPDRIVYKNKVGNVFEFESESESYRQIRNLMESVITDYDESGDTLTEEQIDEIHSKSFIEFDYEKASKNYVIQLEGEEQIVVKLADEGGNIVSKKISNRNKLINTLDALSVNKKAYKFDYKSEISRNKLERLDYKYIALFNEVNNGSAYQVKIDDMEDYEKFVEICNIATNLEITEDTFNDNEVIITVSLIPDIQAKVNIGNIKYTYKDIENSLYGYTVHILVVSKIVNTDCIYNYNYNKIENEIKYDDMKINYDNSVDSLDTNIFVKDLQKFDEEYNNSSSNITQETAKEIAEKGFKEAERICGAYDEASETVEKEDEKANNFFTRKISEGDEIYNKTFSVYKFTRVDDMGCGVSVYVDVRTGKIIGGEAFGD